MEVLFNKGGNYKMKQKIYIVLGMIACAIIFIVLVGILAA